MTGRLKAAALVLLVTAALSSGKLLNAYVDWLWFGELGFRPVFFRTLAFQGIAALAGALAAFFLLYPNWLLAVKLSRRSEPPQGADLNASELTRQRIHLAAPWVCLVLSVLAGASWARHWSLLMAFFHALPFGQTDPHFGMDLGFFLFSLPVWRTLQGVLLLFVTLALAATLTAYALTGRLRLDGRRPAACPEAARHLLALASVWAACWGWGVWLERYALMLQQGPLLTGASYTDVHATLPGLAVSAVCCWAAAAALAFIAARGRSFLRPFLWTVAGMFAVSTVSTRLVPELIQRFLVLPNEAVLEVPFLERHIAMTRRAYGLSAVEERSFPAVSVPTGRDLAAHGGTLRNARVWNHPTILATFSQIQEIRPYYRFSEVDTDRYLIDGRMRQVMLSARELDSAKLASRIWINERLTYTHGYGLVMAPVDEATPEGQPRLSLRDIPPVGDGPEVSRPEVYFGELTHGWVVLNAKTKEFDYPQGSENAYCDYKGSGGIPLSGFLRRLAFTLELGSLKLLLSSDVTARSRVLLRRSVLPRILKVAPFLRFDSDPYLVLAGGRLVWILDGYTHSRFFPYSAPAKGVSYLRNPVKATVDAYDGTVRFYAVDPAEPLLRVYARAFPGLFRPMEEMPPELRGHLRHPRDLFDIQARTYARYHMTDPRVFYNQEDLWEIPSEIREREPAKMQPYYALLQLPNQSREEYVLMVPFTPARKDNLIAWMAARCDKPGGELVVYRFPKDHLVYGPMQVEARLNQDHSISQQFTLWGQRDAGLLRGNLLVLPLESSVLYVKPVYLQSQVGGIPELKGVVAAFGDRIAMEPTLERALKRITSPGATVPNGLVSRKDLPRKTLDLLRQARKDLRRGDWKSFGEAIDEMERLLERWNKP